MSGRVNPRIWNLIGIVIVLIGVVLFLPPYPQDPGYHVFADTRLVCYVPRFGDVVSNIAFVSVGLLGLWALTGVRARVIFKRPLDAVPYLTFYAGVALTGFGSAYYHWEPTTDRLFWDRLPMTLAFTSLTAAFVADRLDQTIGVTRVLPILAAIGVTSLLYWRWTESVGAGDLRLYGLIQFGPFIFLPALNRLFPDRCYTDGRFLFAMIVVYGLAIFLEKADHQVFELTGGLISGHTLKHFFAGAACLGPLAMLQNTRVTMKT